MQNKAESAEKHLCVKVGINEGVESSQVVNIPVLQGPSMQQVEGSLSQGWAASCSSDGCLIVLCWVEILSPQVVPFHLQNKRNIVEANLIH